MERKNLIEIVIILLAGLLSTTALSFQQQASLHQTRLYMGTFVEITVYGKDTHACQRAIDAAFDELEKAENSFSKYMSNSEVSLINKLASQRAVKVSPEVFEVISISQDISKLSDGAFDITVGSLMNIWDLARKIRRVPNREELHGALEVANYDEVILDTSEQTVNFRKAGVQIDLGGIAKGYAVDKAVDALRRYGISSALVNAGGDIFALGSPPSEDCWKVGLQHPRNRDEIVTILELTNQAVVTSGDYENCFFIGDRRYCHIIDPRTGEPVQGMLSTTVIAPSASEADALATAVFVLGLKEGMSFIEGLNQIEGVIIAEDKSSLDNMKIAVSSGLEAKLVFTAQEHKRGW